MDGVNGEFIRCEIQGAVAVITLDRADALNSMHIPLARELRQSLEVAALDAEVRCVQIQANGRYFMAGGDLPAFVQAHEQGGQDQLSAEIDTLIEEAHGVIKAIRQMPKPVVAKVVGGAAGYGLSLVAACDFAVSHKDAVFTTAYTSIGTSPDGGTTYFLPRLLGVRKAAELIMLADRFTGEQAVELTLLNSVVEADELDEHCAKLVERLANGATFSYGRTKMLLNQSYHATLFEQLDAEAQSFSACGRTEDFVNGIKTFVNKGKPEFKGR